MTATTGTLTGHKRKSNHDDNNDDGPVATLMSSSFQTIPQPIIIRTTTTETPLLYPNNVVTHQGITEEEYIRQGCIMNCRMDGRQIHDFRHYTTRKVSLRHRTTTLFAESAQEGGSEVVATSMPFTLSSSSSTFTYGSSELYDTITNGTIIHLLCHIQAEFMTLSTTPTSSCPPKPSPSPLIEISLFSNSSSSSSSDNILLKEYETSLQQYYVPCLRKSLSSLFSLSSSPPELGLLSSSPNKQNQNTTNLLPSLTLWKLYVDVQVVSSIVNIHSNNNHSLSNQSSTNSVYYLDAVTHVINAALYDTMIPSITSSSSSNTMMDTNMDHSIPLMIPPPPQQQQQQQSYHHPKANTNPHFMLSVWALPIIVTTHVIVGKGNDHHDHHYTKHPSVMIADATTEEANISNCAIHMVIVGPYTTASQQTMMKKIMESPSHQPHYPVVDAVWKSKSGTISHSTLTQCVITTQQILAPKAYNSYNRP